MFTISQIWRFNHDALSHSRSYKLTQLPFPYPNPVKALTQLPIPYPNPGQSIWSNVQYWLQLLKKTLLLVNINFDKIEFYDINFDYFNFDDFNFNDFNFDDCSCNDINI